MSLCSVIICTYNRSPVLARALRSLARQSFAAGDFEVVVVDDGSTDNTAEVCEGMRLELPHLRYIATGKNEGLARARNRGVAAAAGEYLLFTDDDCIASEHWVEYLRDALDNRPIIAGAVSCTTSHFFKLCHHIAQFHDYMPGQKAGSKEMLAGANMAFRRSVINDLGGFREDIKCADDMELALRARVKGYLVFFEPRAMVTHDPERTTLKDVVRYAVKHASTTIRIRNYYGAILKTPFVLRSPVLILVAAPVIALRVTAGIYLKNFSLARLFWTAPIVYILKLAWCWGAARGLWELQTKGDSQCRTS